MLLLIRWPSISRSTRLLYVSGRFNASHPGIGKVAVVGDIETAHATQNVSKGAVTVFLDLVSGDYCDRGGSVGDLLYMSQCGVNRDICQLFQAGFAEVLRLLLPSRFAVASRTTV